MAFSQTYAMQLNVLIFKDCNCEIRSKHVGTSKVTCIGIFSIYQYIYKFYNSPPHSKNTLIFQVKTTHLKKEVSILNVSITPPIYIP